MDGLESIPKVLVPTFPLDSCLDSEEKSKILSGINCFPMSWSGIAIEEGLKFNPVDDLLPLFGAGTSVVSEKKNFDEEVTAVDVSKFDKMGLALLLLISNSHTNNVQSIWKKECNRYYQLP